VSDEIEEYKGKKKQAELDVVEGGGGDILAVVEDINRHHALVLVGGRPRILYDADEKEIDLYVLQALDVWWGNHWVRVGEKRRTFAEVWLASPHRRQYRRIVFAPEGADDGDYNLWKGFAIEPAAGSCQLFLDHLWFNVCGENADLYDWVVAWFAQIFQRPWERIGTALVLRGQQGVGKSIVGDVMGSLIGPAHYNLVDHSRYVVGQFNAHMAACLLLQADEAIWAGDKETEGRLKGLVTASHQYIEKKGVDPVRVRNLVRLFMTSNADWVVPAGPEERRFAVVDVRPDHIQDHAYFAAIVEEMENGGREALMKYLLDFDLSKVDLRRIPVTEALFDQKLKSLGDVESWWYDRLWSGSVLTAHIAWETIVPREAMRNAYWTHSKETGWRRRATQEDFRKRLSKMVPVGESRPWMNDSSSVDPTARRRTWCYTLPALAEAREAFTQYAGWVPAWPPESPPDDRGEAADGPI